MDIIVLVVLLLGIFIGYKKGFINVVFGIIGLMLAIVLALMSYKIIVKNIVPKTGLDQTVHSYIEKKYVEKSENLETSINLPKPMQEYFDSTIIVNQTSSSVVDKVTNFIINIITIIILIIIYYIIISIIRIILNNIAKLPGLNLINKLGGACLCGVQTVVIILIVFTLISFYATIGKAEKINQLIDNSIISKKIYNSNFITKMVISSEIKNGEIVNNESIE